MLVNKCSEEDANASIKATCCAQPCAHVVETVTVIRQVFLTGKGQLH